MPLAVVLRFVEQLNTPIGLVSTERDATNRLLLRTASLVGAQCSTSRQKREVFLRSFGSSSDP